MRRFLLGLAAVLLVATGGAASAQTLSYAEAGALIAKSCGPSIERYCSKVNLGGQDLQQCLAQNSAQVPDQCEQDYATVVASIAKRVAAQNSALKICNASIREYCGGVQPGDAHILDCLLKATKVVQPACKQVLLDAGWN